MMFGDLARTALRKLAILMAAFAMITLPSAAMAQDSAGDTVAEESTATAGEAAAQAADATPAFEYFGPDMIKGQPTPYEEDVLQSMTFQPQFTQDGRDALWMNDYILIPMVFGISIFVLGLLLWVVMRYRKAANPTPSRTSHNTLIEVIWTVVPVIILVIIAVPSIALLKSQYRTPPEEAITIKANGYQWNWGYEYVDNGGFEVISNMLSAEDALTAGEPFQLAVDNRMVVPVGVPLRIQTYGADVIHSFAIPSLWFKLDAVPGRINERLLTIDEEGIYYGQCMELCGALHGYMPIAIEARSMEDYNAWVQTKGGKTIAQLRAEAAAAAATETAEVEESAEDAAEAGDADAEAAAEEAGAA